MDGNEDYDPLLGNVNEGLHWRVKSASTAAQRERKKEGTAPKSASNEAVADTARQATNLREMAAAGFLHWMTSSLCSDINPEAFKLYRDKLLADAGNPTDPIEIMLVEQLALAHFAIGRLHIKSCCLDNAKLSVAFTDAATRLMGEFRRCSLALEDYRAKQAARKTLSISNDATEEKTPAARNGKPRPPANGKASNNGNGSTNGRKKAHDSKLTTNGEVPECIRQRMGYATSGASKQTVGIGESVKA